MRIRTNGVLLPIFLTTFMLGPEKFYDKTAAVELASLMTPDAPFAVFLTSECGSLISMRNPQIEISPVCRDYAAVGPDGALLVTSVDRRLAAVFVSEDGSVSDPFIIPLSFDSYIHITYGKLRWTGSAFDLFFTRDLTAVWHVRFGSHGEMIGEPEMLIESNGFTFVSSLVQTATGPLVFVHEYIVARSMQAGALYAYPVDQHSSHSVGRLDGNDLAVTVDSNSRLFAAWTSYTTPTEAHPEFIQVANIGYLDMNGNAINRQQLGGETAFADRAPSVGWDGHDFVVATDDGKVAAVANAIETPHFISVADDAYDAYVIPGNGHAAVVYSAIRRREKRLLYRLIYATRERPSKSVIDRRTHHR